MMISRNMGILHPCHLAAEACELSIRNPQCRKIANEFFPVLGQDDSRVDLDVS